MTAGDQPNRPPSSSGIRNSGTMIPADIEIDWPNICTTDKMPIITQA